MGSSKRPIRKALFTAEGDGLYLRLNHRPKYRVAKQLGVVSVGYRDGQLVIQDLKPPKSNMSKKGKRETVGDEWLKHDPEISTAAATIKGNLNKQVGIIDLLNGRSRYGVHCHVGSPLDQTIDRLKSAAGFLMRLPGIGPAFVIWPGTVTSWISGAVSARAVLDLIKMEGWLITGCDGKRTRQVFVRRLGRKRFYCFKPLEPIKTLIKDAAPRDPIKRPRRRGDWYDDEFDTGPSETA